MNSKNYIQLEIKNNLALPASVIVMGGQWNPNNQANAKYLYEYDLSTETFIGVSQVQLFFFESANFTQFNKTAHINGNIQSLVAALNSFNLGLWFSSGTTIYTYNSNYIFDNIIIS